MVLRRAWTPHTTRLFQLAATWLVVLYMLFVGDTFAASIVYPVQRLDLLGGAALVLVWLGVRLAQRHQLRVTGLELPLIVFGASQWLAVFTSSQPRLGLDWAASVTAWIAAYFILMDLIASGWPRAYWINGLVIAGVILAAHGIIAAGQWFAGWAAVGSLPPITFRYTGLLGHANLTACIINLLWPIVLAKLFQASRLIARLGLAVLAVSLGITSFFTSSRGGWLAAGVALALLIALMSYAQRGREWLKAARSAWQRWPAGTRLVAVAGLVVMVAAGAWLLGKESQHITHGSLFESRQQFWSVAWELFKSRPLTGVGPDVYPWYYSRYASVPPEFFAPHAHSLIFQILSGSGVLGLGALLWLGGSIALRLWKSWQASGRQLQTACLIAALVSFAVHQFFDFLVTPLSLLFTIVILALVILPETVNEPARQYHPILVAPLLLLPIGVFGALLNISRMNDAALKLAAHGQWLPAARLFEQAAQADPHLTLYGEEAAYAYTRGGDIQSALPLWDRAARDDPYWAVLPATTGALRQDLRSAQAAQALAPRSYLFALNTGVVAEAQGQPTTAQDAYQAALNLKPGIAEALFWQQSPFRSGVLAAWQSRQPSSSSTLADGWTALSQNAPDQAAGLFREAVAADAANPDAYLGLGRAYLKLRDLGSAQRALLAGLTLPIAEPEQALGLHLLAGDLAQARGDPTGAMAEYNAVFAAIADYNIDGPGSYGQPLRSWLVFHREALPGELVRQLPRADITAAMDQRFAELAQSLRAGGQPDAACVVLERVQREAPVSASGSLYRQQCGAQ